MDWSPEEPMDSYRKHIMADPLRNKRPGGLFAGKLERR